jgi:hypothetical protein
MKVNKARPKEEDSGGRGGGDRKNFGRRER